MSKNCYKIMLCYFIEMIYFRKNTGYNAITNPSATFARLVKSVNPQNEFTVKPSFKVPKPRAGYSLDVNVPPKPIDPKPFSRNF
jgi:hypothetical protein